MGSSSLSSQRVLIASDHAGFALKAAIQKALPDLKWEDLGPPDTGRVDYPDFAEKLARKVAAGEATRGVLICGSGIGMSIAANKVAGIRAALVENPVAARLSRQHNDANVLCLGSRFLAPEYGAEIVQVWIDTPYSSQGEGARHQARIDKMTALDSPTKRK